MGTDHGREERFRRLYEEAYGRVHAYVARRVGVESADEVAAEVFLIAWRRFDDLPAEQFPWLYGVARNVVRSQLRGEARRARTRGALSLERGPVSDHADVGDHAVWSAWEQLSDADREVLALVAWEELPVREAAVVVGCSAPAFSVRLFRARKRLERLMEGQAPAQDQVTTPSEA